MPYAHTSHWAINRPPGGGAMADATTPTSALGRCGQFHGDVSVHAGLAPDGS